MEPFRFSGEPAPGFRDFKSTVPVVVFLPTGKGILPFLTNYKQKKVQAPSAIIHDRILWSSRLRTPPHLR